MTVLSSRLAAGIDRNHDGTIAPDSELSREAVSRLDNDGSRRVSVVEVVDSLDRMAAHPMTMARLRSAGEALDVMQQANAEEVYQRQSARSDSGNAGIAGAVIGAVVGFTVMILVGLLFGPVGVALFGIAAAPVAFGTGVGGYFAGRHIYTEARSSVREAMADSDAARRTFVRRMESAVLRAPTTPAPRAP